MAKPNYQEVSSSKIPFVNNGNVTAKVIAGKAMGARAVIKTWSVLNGSKEFFSKIILL
jgi:redox-sensitive bicupin YhaK (pirin superfamily)